MLITQHQLNEHMHTNRTTVNNFFPDKPKFIHNTIKFTRFYYNFVIILVKSAAFWECSQISFAVLFKVNSNFICNKKRDKKNKGRERMSAKKREIYGHLTFHCVFMWVCHCAWRNLYEIKLFRCSAFCITTGIWMVIVKQANKHQEKHRTVQIISVIEGEQHDRERERELTRT